MHVRAQENASPAANQPNAPAQQVPQAAGSQFAEDQKPAGSLAELPVGKPEPFKTDNGIKAWRVKILGDRPLATPVVVSGILFVGGGFASHEFYALDAATSARKWAFLLDPRGQQTMLASNAGLFCSGQTAYRTLLAPIDAAELRKAGVQDKEAHDSTRPARRPLGWVQITRRSSPRSGPVLLADYQVSVTNAGRSVPRVRPGLPEGQRPLPARRDRAHQRSPPNRLEELLPDHWKLDPAATQISRPRPHRPPSLLPRLPRAGVELGSPGGYAPTISPKSPTPATMQRECRTGLRRSPLFTRGCLWLMRRRSWPRPSLSRPGRASDATIRPGWPGPASWRARRSAPCSPGGA